MKLYPSSECRFCRRVFPHWGEQTRRDGDTDGGGDFTPGGRRAEDESFKSAEWPRINWGICRLMIWIRLRDAFLYIVLLCSEVAPVKCAIEESAIWMTFSQESVIEMKNSPNFRKPFIRKCCFNGRISKGTFYRSDLWSVSVCRSNSIREKPQVSSSCESHVQIRTKRPRGRGNTQPHMHRARDKINDERWSERSCYAFQNRAKTLDRFGEAFCAGASPTWNHKMWRFMTPCSVEGAGIEWRYFNFFIEWRCFNFFCLFENYCPSAARQLG